jgi:hypothetical protein
MYNPLKINNYEMINLLLQYLPNGHIIPAHGDQLSVERMTEAKRARKSDIQTHDQLRQLEEVPQEFHHRMLTMQACALTKDDFQLTLL